MTGQKNHQSITDDGLDSLQPLGADLPRGGHSFRESPSAAGLHRSMGAVLAAALAERPQAVPEGGTFVAVAVEEVFHRIAAVAAAAAVLGRIGDKAGLEPDRIVVGQVGTETVAELTAVDAVEGNSHFAGSRSLVADGVLAPVLRLPQRWEVGNPCPEWQG